MEGKIDPLVEGDLDRSDLENVSDNKTYMLTNSDIDSELAAEAKKELFDPDTIKTSWFGNNVITSLFWEEKIVMIIRYLQFYGFLMAELYEFWPFDSRQYF